MEAESLPDGRIRLVLSRDENRFVGYALLEALPELSRNDSDLHVHVGVSAEEAGSLDDEWSILKRRLFGLPEFHPRTQIERQLYAEYLERLPEKPRGTGTSWDDLFKMEAELLSDGRVAYTLARGELSIFAGAIDVMLKTVARDRDMSSRAELSARGGGTIEEFEALRDELWRVDHELRGKPTPSPLYDPPRPKVASGRVGDVDTFAAQHRLARMWSRERDPVTDERMEADLTADGRARIVVSALCLQQLYEAFWPWHSMYWDEPDFVGPGGASAEQAQELSLEISRIRQWLDEERRDRWASKGLTLCKVQDGKLIPSLSMSRYLDIWGDVLVTEAEVLPDERIALILPLVKLKVLIGFMEVSLADEKRYRRFYRDFTQEESEALTDYLRKVYKDLSHKFARREGSSEDKET